MEVTQEQVPVFGEQGEPCHECGAPLASDQRYCLNCGRRRAGPRVDYRQLIGATGAEPAAEAQPSPAEAAPAEPERAERDYAPLAAVGGIAVLGLMLLVGVLIGKGNNSTTPAPAPIVRIPTEASDTAGTDEGDEKSRTAEAGKGSKKGGGTGAKAVAGGLTGSAARSAKGTVQASTDDLEALEGQTGEDYEDAVKKLPDKIATPGAPPPIDTSKAPGGGGSAETFE